MNFISVVIITRNEENNIVDCIRSAKLVSDDIIVVDSGSSDNTVQLVTNEGVQLFLIDWQGYWYSRNFGAAKAKNPWILALDADERISPELANSINALKFSEADHVFKFKRKNYLGNKEIRFGTPGFETVSRIYNRNYCEWDLTPVHEKIISENNYVKKPIKGHITHQSIKNYKDYKNKMTFYAQMSAKKYLIEGRKPGFLKRYLSPLFNSFKSYVLQLGFMEGRQGFIIARTIAYYSWLKYFYLHQLQEQPGKEEPAFLPRQKIETVSN